MPMCAGMRIIRCIFVALPQPSEIGIRMALGAKRASVIALVMRGALMQALVGLMIGVLVALLLCPVCEDAAVQHHEHGRGVCWQAQLLRWLRRLASPV
jgi:FtsX-like permease family